MDFYKLIKSLDELVYEVLSWLLFYPLTLLNVLRAPVETMQSVERELSEDEEHSFDEILGPPLFLALTIGLLHILELAVAPAFQSQGRFAEFLADDKNLLAVRIIIFGALPLIAAIRLNRHRGLPLEKSSLRSAVYAQCYASAVFAMIFQLPAMLGAGVPLQYQGWPALIGFLTAVVWLAAVEMRWFRKVGGMTLGRAIGSTAWVGLGWLLVFVSVGLIFS